MAAQQKESTSYENPSFGAYTGYAENATNTMREMLSWQMKAAHNFYDQGLRAAQTWADFAQTQIQEGARLSQEFMKMGMQNSDELKKSLNYFNDKFFHSGR